MGMGEQHEIDAVKREVAAEREETHPRVTVDVALADLDESSTEGQQFQAGALGRTGEGIEHDVDSVSVGVTANQLGELGAAGVVYVFNSPFTQQFSTPRAACGGKDRGTGGVGDR